MSSVIQQYYEKLFDLMLSPAGKIKVNTDFHGQMSQINSILKNDTTAYISTILEYMIHAGNVPLTFNSNNKKLNNLFDEWQKNINKNLNIDIPRGLRHFTEQYLRERWKSSLIVTSLIWEQVDGFKIPTKMYVMDGASIHIEGGSQIDSNKYYLGKPSDKNRPLTDSKNRSYIVRKPYNQLYDDYPTPYLVRKGAMYHALFKTKFLDRQAEVINTAFPYQLLIKVGSQEAIKRGLGPSEEELKNILEQFQNKKKEYDEHAYARGLAGAFPGDVNLEELIPDYKRIMDDAITKPIDKNILSALGMIELKGFSSDREEAILNPKVLVEEVKDAVLDYLDFIQEVVYQIKERNSSKYTVNDKVEVEAGTIKTFLTEKMKDLIRSWYDRGLVSQEDGLESTTDLNFKTQVIKRDQERKANLDLRMYPRVTQNLEKDPADSTPKEDIPDDKKKNTPESLNYKSEEELEAVKKKLEESEYIQAPYENIDELPASVKNALPVQAQIIFLKAFNSAIDQGNDEETAFKIAWSAVKKKYRKPKENEKKWQKK